MNFQDKEYQILAVIGMVLPTVTILLGDWLPDVIRHVLIGMAFGWIGAVTVIKFYILKGEKLKSKKKLKKSKDKLKEYIEKANKST